MPVIQFEAYEGQVKSAPVGFLGRDYFGNYLEASRQAGARFEPKIKSQVFPLDSLAVMRTKLAEAGFDVQIAPELAATIQAKVASLRASKEEADARMTEVDAELAERGLALFPFQRQDIKRMSLMDRCINANPMGLGKTIETLAALPFNVPVLVICPAVVKGVWMRESRKWRPDLSPEILKGTKSFRWPNPGELVATNYDILPANPEEWLQTCPDNLVMVLDEGHVLKNSKTLRTQRLRTLISGHVNEDKEPVKGILGRGGRCWLLTGTPIINRPQELFSLLVTTQTLEMTFGSWPRFCKLFDGQKTDYSWSWGVASPAAIETLQRVMIRHEKEDVLPDLPSKTRNFIELEVDSEARAAFREIAELLAAKGMDLEEAFALVESKDGEIAFEDFSRAFQRLAVAKIPYVMRRIEDLEEELNGDPIIVACNYLAPIEMFKDREGWAVLTGATSAAKRTQIEEDFQAGKYRGLAMTIGAGGVGITLTKSSYMMFIDRDWTPALNLQCEDRIARIGQLFNCQYDLMVWDHPLEMRRAEILDEKTRIIEGSIVATGRASKDHVLADKDHELEDALINAVIGKTPSKEEQVAEARKKMMTALRPAANVLEEWAIKGARQLTAFDPDQATSLNGVGWNKFDGGPGRMLTNHHDEHGGLTDRQWSMLIGMVSKYHRQVGSRPLALPDEINLEEVPF